MSVVVGMLMSAPAYSQKPGLDVRVNRAEIYIGESVSVQIIVSGIRNPPAPDLSKIQGCEITSLGGHDISRHSLTIINGRRLEQRFVGHKFSYAIKPRAPGVVRIGPVTLDTSGRRMTTAGHEVKVLKIEKQDQVLIDIHVSRESVLIDEPFDVTLRYRLKRLPGRFAAMDPIFLDNPPALSADFLKDRPIAGLGGPEPAIKALLNKHVVDRRTPGLHINDYQTVNDPFGFGFNFRGFMNDREKARFKFPAKEVTVNAVAYFEHVVTLRYAPEELGDYTFGPAILKGQFPVDVDANGSARPATIYAVGAARTVRVVPPPVADRPESYIGVVARDLTCEAELDAQTCHVGDPLKLTLTIETDGRLGNVSPPALSTQPEITALFRVYDDTAQMTRKDNRVVVKCTIRPMRAGTFELPPIEIAYYDLDDRKYSIARTEPIPIRANEIAQVALDDVIGATNTGTQVLSSGDVEPLIRAPLDLDPNGARHSPLVETRLAWLVAAAGPAFFGLCLVAHGTEALLRRRRRQLQRTSLASALKRLAHARDGTMPGARRDCLDAVRDYVASNYNVPRDGLTPADIRRVLIDRGVDDETGRKISGLVETMFNAEFSTDDTAGRFQSDCDELIDLLRKTGRTTGRGQGAVRMVLLTLVLAQPLMAGASQQPFLWNQANAHISSAQTAEDFLAAARVYQRLVNSGIRNGPLFYNLGTALLNAEQYEAATVALRRAERYSGSSTDIRRNLRLALAGTREDAATHLPWYRTPLFLHYLIPASHQGIVVAAAFALCWVAAGLRLWRIQTWRSLLLVSIVAIIVFGSSVFSIIHKETAEDRNLPNWTSVRTDIAAGRMALLNHDRSP